MIIRLAPLMSVMAVLQMNQPLSKFTVMHGPLLNELIDSTKPYHPFVA